MFIFFFFNDTATTEIYTLSLHDALPIFRQIAENAGVEGSIVVGKINDNKSATYGFNAQTEEFVDMLQAGIVDPVKVVRTAQIGRATRLNSSHANISYAVFCLKKKKTHI